VSDQIARDGGGAIGLVPPAGGRVWPSPPALLELLKPITWFAPIWAFGCGIACAGGPGARGWGVVAIGAVLSGPLACGTSQAVNDWYDRHVDAINEPFRPIPSGRVPGQWGFGIAVGWTILTAAVAFLLGTIVVVATAIGLLLAWVYSAPPIRLKRNGWWSNLAVGISYEGLPWFAGAAVCVRAMPSDSVILVALIYSLGAHGIMTLNDFKSIEGDRQMGLGSLPAKLGPDRACRLACLTMAAAQVVIVMLLLTWRMPIHACIVVALLTAQLVLMLRLLDDPRGRAPWYNATGTTLYVLGMLVTAFALAP
jgi:chlorophyll/bacteriochlorophyll a synthase